MKGGKYAKTLAKIQVRGIFRTRDIRRNVLPKFIEILWRRHAGAHLDEHQHGGRRPAETSVTEFCYKTVILGENNQKISFIDYYISNCLRRHFKKL